MKRTPLKRYTRLTAKTPWNFRRSALKRGPIKAKVRKPLPKHSKNPRSVIEKRLDTWMSKVIRNEAVEKMGFTYCYTCGRIVRLGEFDAGHYISRDHKGTQWDERNVKPQCEKCNRFQSGMSDEFALHLVKDYGPDILVELNQAKWKPVMITSQWILDRIEHYKERWRALKARKSVSVVSV